MIASFLIFHQKLISREVTIKRSRCTFLIKKGQKDAIFFFFHGSLECLENELEIGIFSLVYWTGYKLVNFFVEYYPANIYPFEKKVSNIFQNFVVLPLIMKTEKNFK